MRERSLLHAAGDFLERNGPADGGEIFIENLVRSRQRGFCLAGFFSLRRLPPGVLRLLMMGVATGSVEPRWQK